VYPVEEDFGIAMAEAQACGTPVVGLAAGGAVDIVEPGVTGWLVEPDDAGALAGALAEAMGDPVERRRRGRRAWRAARERYSWPALAGAFAEVLDEVADVPDGRQMQARQPTA
jgi:glycosyltransferase involved in cell wall biosynthesis